MYVFGYILGGLLILVGISRLLGQGIGVDKNDRLKMKGLLELLGGKK